MSSVDAWTMLRKLWGCEKGYSGGREGERGKGEGGREGGREGFHHAAVDFPQVQLVNNNDDKLFCMPYYHAGAYRNHSGRSGHMAV